MCALFKGVGVGVAASVLVTPTSPKILKKVGLKHIKYFVINKRVNVVKKVSY